MSVLRLTPEHRRCLSERPQAAVGGGEWGGWTGSVCESTSGSRINAASSAAETHLKEAYLPEQERSLVRGGGGGLGGSGGERKHPSGPGRCGGLFPLTLRCFSKRKSAATLMKFDHKFPQGASNEQLFLEAVLSADPPPPPPPFPPPIHPQRGRCACGSAAFCRSSAGFS